MSVLDAATEIRAGQRRAADDVAAALARIDARNPELNAFTHVARDRALAQAAEIDRRVARGKDPGPLAGQPYAVKNLFDMAGVTTLAGSRIYAERPPAARDAFAIRALARAGAVLVGALNMDEFSAGITTENSHYGPARNPLDWSRVAGGSSGGTSAAVAGGMVPFGLGTDTGGSVRVPAAMCGLVGIKPSFGRLSRSGTVPFAQSVDHVGVMAHSVRDAAAIYDALQGHDPEDPFQATKPHDPASAMLDDGLAGLRLATLDGWFREHAGPQALTTLDKGAALLGATDRVVLPRTEVARAAMNIIVMAEAGAFHGEDLRRRPRDFDLMTRDKLLSGALLPTAYVQAARRFRAWYRDAVLALFADHDVFLAPTLPFAATRIGQDTASFGDAEVPCRPMFTMLTAPLSFIGLPVVTVPIGKEGEMPLGIQIVAPPFAEATALRVARVLEARCDRL